MIRPAALSLLSLLLTQAASGQKKEFKPNMGPDLETITAKSGDISIVLRQSSQWTVGRIDFDGTAMTTERSAYGTVFMFPEIGFIGTAHLENEPEEITQLTFQLDGVPISEEKPVLDAGKNGTFTFMRNSRIRGFNLRNEIEIQDNKLYETTTIQTVKDIDLKLVYNFMHAWKPSVSRYLAASGDKTYSGPLNDSPELDRKFFVNAEIDWFAVYEPESQKFAVSFLLIRPVNVDSRAKIWNVPGAYRKFYLTSFQNKTVPASERGYHWKMVTGFGKAELKNWENAAQKMAAKLSKDKDDPS